MTLLLLVRISSRDFADMGGNKG